MNAKSPKSRTSTTVPLSLMHIAIKFFPKTFINGGSARSTSGYVNWRLAFSLSVCFALLSSIAQPLALASVSEQQGTSSSDAQLSFSTLKQDESLIIPDPEAALDNHPELRELWDRQRYFFATVQWIEKTLGEVENALVALEGDPASSAILENLVKTAELRAENLENKFLDLLWTLENMDGLPALFVNDNGARWVRINGQFDNRLKMWVENVLLQTHKLIEKLRALQENSGQEAIDEVLIHVAATRELLDVPPSEHGGVEDLWFERWDGTSWRRTAEAHPNDSIRMKAKLHNPRWIEREKLWIKVYWRGWYLGEWYFDLPALYTGEHELYSTTAPYAPGSYKFYIEGRWESWSCFFCWPIKTGGGTIPKWEITLEVKNRAPKSERQPVSPDKGPWGTTFTYSTDVKDFDGHWVEVTLYKDGIKYGGSKWVHGSGTPTWTWTSTSADIGDHNYYFVATDGYETTRDPLTGTHSGPTVTKRGTSLTMSVSNREPAIGQSVTFSGYLMDTFANAGLGGKTIKLDRRPPGSGSWTYTGWSATTSASGYYNITVTPSGTYYYRARFEGDTAYGGSTSSEDWVKVRDKTPPPAPRMYPEPAYTQDTTNTVSWTAVTDPWPGTGTRDYYVQRATNSAFTAGVWSPGWISATSYNFTGLSDRVIYYYRVKARDWADPPNESGWSNVVSSTQDATAPPAPSVSSWTHPSSDVWYANPNPSFSWTKPYDVSGISGYSYALDSIPLDRINTYARSASLTGVSDGEHTFYLKAQDGAGNWGKWPGGVGRYTFRINTTSVQSYYSGFFLKGLNINNTYEFIPPAQATLTHVVFRLGTTVITDSNPADGWKATFDMGNINPNTELRVEAYDGSNMVFGPYISVPKIYEAPDWLQAMINASSISVSERQRDGRTYWVAHISVGFDDWLAGFNQDLLDFLKGDAIFYVPVEYVSGTWGLTSQPLSLSFELGSDEEDTEITFSGESKVDLKVAGYGAEVRFRVGSGFTFNSTSRTVEWTGILIGIEGRTEFSYWVPVVWYIIPGAVGVTVAPHANLDLTLGPQTTVEGGIGAEVSGWAFATIGLVSGRLTVGGDGTLWVTIPDFSPHLTVKIFVRGEAWGLFWKVWEDEWGWTWSSNPSTLNMIPDNSDEWELIDRTYATADYSQFVWGEGNMKGTLVQNVYPFANPSIAVNSDGDMIAAWTHDNVDKDVRKAFEIYYSYYDSDALTWSEPAALTANDLLDFSPLITFLDDGRAIAVWHRVPYEISASTPPSETLSNVELVYSVWYPRTRTWSEPRAITSGGSLNMMPSIGKIGNQLMLVYVLDEDDNPFTFEGNSLYCARWDGGAWAEPELLEQGVTILSVPSVAMLDENNGILAFARDMDENILTIDDREIYFSRYLNGGWGEPQRLTWDNKEDISPSLTWLDGKSHLSWIKRNVEKEDSSIDVIYMGEVSDRGISTLSTVAENSIISYQQLSSDGSDLYLIYQTGWKGMPYMLRYRAGIWEEMGELTGDGYYYQLSADIHDGHMGIVIMDAQMNIVNNMPIHTRSDIYVSIPDIMPPQPPEFVSPADGYATSDNTPTFEWSPASDPSGIAGYDLELDDDVDFSSPELSEVGLLETTFTPTVELVDGIYYWRVRVIDGAGNVGDWSSARTLIIDTTPPTAPALISPENGAQTDNTPTFKWSAVEDPSDVIYTLQYSTDPEFPEAQAPAQPQVIFEDEFADGLVKWNNFGYPSPGTFQNSAFRDGWGYATNGDGYYPSGSYSKELIDMTAPFEVEFRVKQEKGSSWWWRGRYESWWDFCIIGIGAVQSGYSQSSIPMYFSTGIKGYRPDGDIWYTASGSPTYYETANDYQFHTYLMRYNLATVEFYRDGNLITTLSIDPAPHDKLPLVINGRDYRNTNYLDYIVVRTLGAPAQPPAAITVTAENLINNTYTVPGNESLSEGTWYWRVRAVDGAGNVGNWSQTWSFEAVADNTPPVSFVENIEPYWRNELPLSITAQATDDRSGVENVTLWYRYSPDNVTWRDWQELGVDDQEPWEWLFDAPEGEGYYEFYTIAADRAGNVEAAPEDADARAGVDTMPPESSVDPIDPYWQTSTPFAVTATASDELSGVASVELYYHHSLDNSTWGDWASFGVDTEEPYSWSFDIPASHGFYEFYSVARDMAGNVEEPPVEADARCATLIPATIDIDPDTLNLRSQGRWITAYIELPGGLDVANIDVSTMALEGDVFLEGILSAEPWPTEISDHDGDGVPDLMVKFDRSAVQGLVSIGDNVELTVIGKWGPAPFRGSDTIRVIEPGEGQGQGHGNKPEVPPGQLGEAPGQGRNQGQGQGPPQTPPGQGEQPPGQGNQGNQG